MGGGAECRQVRATSMQRHESGFVGTEILRFTSRIEAFVTELVRAMQMAPYIVLGEVEFEVKEPKNVVVILAERFHDVNTVARSLEDRSGVGNPDDKAERHQSDGATPRKAQRSGAIDAGGYSVPNPES